MAVELFQTSALMPTTLSTAPYPAAVLLRAQAFPRRHEQEIAGAVMLLLRSDGGILAGDHDPGVVCRFSRPWVRAIYSARAHRRLTDARGSGGSVPGRILQVLKPDAQADSAACLNVIRFKSASTFVRTPLHGGGALALSYRAGGAAPVP